MYFFLALILALTVCGIKNKQIDDTAIPGLSTVMMTSSSHDDLEAVFSRELLKHSKNPSQLTDQEILKELEKSTADF